MFYENIFVLHLDYQHKDKKYIINIIHYDNDMNDKTAKRNYHDEKKT